MKLDVFGKSVKGRSHERNEDSFLIDANKNLFAVADGVSIPKNGGTASKNVISLLSANFRGNLKESFLKVNELLVKFLEENLLEGYTTLTAVHFDKRISICNVGDSPCFLIRKGKLVRLTNIDRGWDYPYLKQAMGERYIIVHSKKENVEKGDVFVLMTDGVYDVLDEREIVETVSRENAKKAVEKLIEAAEEKPKIYDDDKTVIVIKVV